MSTPLVTDADVRGIIETNEALPIAPFIKTAHALVTWLDGLDTDGELTDDLLYAIELNLTAHFYTHRDKQYQTKTTGRAMAQYQGQTAMILTSSDFGQTAMLLDVTGALAQQSKAAETGIVGKASVIWMGTPTCEYDV